jgi:hypothetical protein
MYNGRSAIEKRSILNLTLFISAQNPTIAG